MELYGFGLGVGVACLAGGAVGRSLARRRGVSRDDWWRLVVGLMVWGMIGGRLAYVVPHAGYYLANPIDIVRPPIEGYSYYGAVALGALYVARFSRRIQKPFGFVADLVAQPWLFALLICGLIWGVPVIKAGAPSWLVVSADVVYITVLYALLGWAGKSQRRFGGTGRLAMIVLAADALLRLVAGLAFAPHLPAMADDVTANHVLRALALVIGVVGAVGSGPLSGAAYGGGVAGGGTSGLGGGTGSGIGGVGHGGATATAGGSSRLSRWAGWILVYVALIAIRVLTQV